MQRPGPVKIQTRGHRCDAAPFPPSIQWQYVIRYSVVLLRFIGFAVCFFSENVHNLLKAKWVVVVVETSEYILLLVYWQEILGTQTSEN